MARVRSNIITNLIATVLATVTTAAITPVQVNLLGMEAYGVIGFVTTLQIIFVAFDLGLSSTLMREIASRQAEHDHKYISELIQSASTVYWSFAFLIGGVLALLANPIAHNWFNSRTLDPQVLEHALYLIIAFLSLRWPVALYTGVLTGLQRLDVVNMVKIGATALRNLGGIAVIFAFRDIQLFLAWLVLVAFIEVATFYVAARSNYHTGAFRLGFSLAAVRSVWRFSLSMGGLSILALLISQFDRIAASKLLSLKDLGYYTLAYNTAAIATVATTAISSAMLPSFAASQKDRDLLQRRYLDASRVALFLMGGVAFALIFFGHVVLRTWISVDAATGAAPALAILSLGFWLNAGFSNAYNITIALGQPGLSLRISALSALPYAVTLIVLTQAMAAIGTALAWLLLTLVYLFTLVPPVHRRLLGIATMPWVMSTLLPFGAAGVLTFGTMRVLTTWLYPDSLSVVPEFIALVVAGALYSAVSYRLLGHRIRAQLIDLATTPIKKRRFHVEQG